jgi:DNA primase
MKSDVEAIKERLQVADVIGSYIKLEKAGKNFKARCPFHNEKTPSFFISPDRGTYHCFGCPAKGDIFTFVQEFEGIDFHSALKLLADRAGIKLSNTKEDPKRREEKDTLFEIMEAATKFYEERLAQKKDALEYLMGRGLEAETVSKFRLGYAPSDWRELHGHLTQIGFSEVLIEKAGLIKKAERKDGTLGYYDRFRGRIMFPIDDASGRVIAFTGRIFEKPANTEVEPAKYVNSPETPLFQKSEVLYGFDKAKDSIRRHNFVIVVEGQMDALMSHQAGYGNTVAISGTALTDMHLARIKRLSENMVLALDKDTAGIAATSRSAVAALKAGFDVKVATIASGKDPADLIKEDATAWKGVIRESKHVIEFLLDVAASYGYDERKFKREASKLVLPYVRLINSSVDRSHFVQVVARKLGVTPTIIEEELRLLPSDKEQATRATTYETKESTQPGSDRVREREEEVLHHLLAVIAYLKGVHDEALKPILTELKVLVPNYEEVQEREREVLSPMIFRAETMYQDHEKALADAHDLLIRFKLAVLKKERDQLKSALTKQQPAKESAELLKRYQVLVREVDQLSRQVSESGILI